MAHNSGSDSGDARRILLDSPTSAPALGFDEIGGAFARIISQSEPRFAVGIFGGWGSGKTTLMKTIKAKLSQSDIVMVDFNAWRFEREPQLLIPLLDAIRAALVRWSADHDKGEKIRSIAARIGRVVRALASGLSAQVGLPGAVTVSYDAGAALAALSSPADPANSQSLYVAAFAELDAAFQELADGGVSRVVVFVDDLDRCLPGNALQVLESMKLFFDLQGFVFVVGLDEDVVERAIRAKFVADGYQPAGTGAQTTVGTDQLPRLGREYIKKIFQVPYSLPPMLPQQLDDLLRSMYKDAGIDGAQLAELKNRVHPYLGYVAVDRRVNPREVKRFINAYTLQVMVRPDLDPDTVLALLTLSFRYDWESFYLAILGDSALFTDALRRYRKPGGADESPFEDVAPELIELPASLAGFLGSGCAAALTKHQSLDTYLSSLQSYRPAGSWELDAFGQVGRLGRAIKFALDQDDLALQVGKVGIEALEVIDGLRAALPEASAESAGFSREIDQVQRIVSDLRKLSEREPPGHEVMRAKLVELRDVVVRSRKELRRVRDSSIFRP